MLAIDPLNFVYQHGTELLTGSSVTLLVTACARHIPDWPLTYGKMWEWLRGTVQEVVSQRSGMAIGTVSASPATPSATFPQFPSPVSPTQPEGPAIKPPTSADLLKDYPPLNSQSLQPPQLSPSSALTSKGHLQ